MIDDLDLFLVNRSKRRLVRGTRPRQYDLDDTGRELMDRQQLSKWTKPPETLLLVQKPNDAPTSAAMGLLLKCALSIATML